MTLGGFKNEVAAVLSGLIDAVDDAPDIDGLIEQTVAKIVELAVAHQQLINLEDPVGFVKGNGCGEIIFRQAGHPSTNPPAPWRPVYVR